MAKEVTEKQVIAAIKKLGVEAAISAYAAELGVPTGSIGPTIWKLEPRAQPSLKFKGNKSEIVKARKGGMRWERIAARTGLSVAEAKKIGGADANVYTGRGRRFDGSSPNGGGSGKRQSGRGQSKATSGRRGKSNGKSGPKAGRRPQARTRAEAQAKAGRRPS